MKYTLVFLGLFMVISACNKPDYPVFKEVRELKFKGLKKGSVKMIGEAVYYNPNSFGVDVVAMEMDVYLDGKDAGTITQNIKAEMLAESEFIIPLEIDIPLRTVFKGLGLKLGSIFKDKEVEIRVVGNILVDLIGGEIQIPFDEEDSYVFSSKNKGEEIEVEEAE